MGGDAWIGDLEDSVHDTGLDDNMVLGRYVVVVLGYGLVGVLIFCRTQVMDTGDVE